MSAAAFVCSAGKDGTVIDATEDRRSGTSMAVGTLTAGRSSHSRLSTLWIRSVTRFKAEGILKQEEEGEGGKKKTEKRD